MAKLDSPVGQIVGKVKVLKRVENFEGKSDSRSQYLIGCLVCDGQHRVVGRDLKRYAMRFKKGCYKCSNFIKTPSKKFKYGRNRNGFIDKTIIIYEE